MSDSEKWLPVPGLNFMASSLGRIRNLDKTASFTREGRLQTCRLKGRVVSPWMGNKGYLLVSQKADGQRKKFQVHRLVCLAFVPGFRDGLTVNHKNGVKTDNRPENLEWCTLAENTSHQWQIGLVNLRGERQPGSKLKAAQVVEIKRRLSAGDTNIALLASDYGVSDSLIYLIKKGQRWAWLNP